MTLSVGRLQIHVPAPGARRSDHWMLVWKLEF
jgi:hypothetical protein